MGRGAALPAPAACLSIITGGPKRFLIRFPQSDPRSRVLRRIVFRCYRCIVLCLLLTFALTESARAQDSSAPPEPSTAGRPQPLAAVTPATTMQAHGELLLVLPFENAGTDASVDWIGSAFPEILNQRFLAAGFLPINRSDRAYALEHLGLPADFQPTRASTLRLAQTLDVDSVIFGSYQVTGDQITATARILDVGGLRESGPITETAPLSQLPTVLNTLAWQITRQLDPGYTVAEQTFIAADANLRLDAFEDYMRGIVQGPPQDRLNHLRDAVRLDPSYDPAWLALGNAYFAAQDYENAALAYGHLNRDDPNALQADFHRGLAYFYIGKYLQAEDAFAFVSARLPLPEVVNDEGVAAERRGHNGAPFFQQAITGDPKDADYRFNLALAYARQDNVADAEKQMVEALKLSPNDSEMQAFAQNLKTPGFLQAPAATSAGGDQSAENTNLPLERIKRSYDEAAFRQAAFEMEQMQTLREGTQSAAERLAALLKEAHHYLNDGLLVESEREYNRAIALDPKSAAAYAGLAAIRERTSEPNEARTLATKSLQLGDNPAAHLVLARLALLANQIPNAATQVGDALRIAPTDTDALGLRQAVLARGGQVP